MYILLGKLFCLPDQMKVNIIMSQILRLERTCFIAQCWCVQPTCAYQCFCLQVGRLLQQLAMTGTEEGDPRTKNSLGKFDKVGMNVVLCEILFVKC